jgi:hypothetical protein
MILCKIFGHRWRYTTFTPTKYRACRCGALEQYISMAPVWDWEWVRMVQYTKRGSARMLARLLGGGTNG